MTAPVIVELVDFKKQSWHNELSYRDDNHHLINLLKKGLSTDCMKFSLNFHQVATLHNVKYGYGFDTALSDDYDKLIICEGNEIIVYNRATSAVSLDSKPLFNVVYDVSFRCLRLVKEMGREYLYATCKDDSIVKIRISDLMMQNSSLVWKSKEFSNVCGLDIINGRVYIVQYIPSGIIVLDCENGQPISDKNLPKLSKGYGIHFFSEKEMLISHSKHLELFSQHYDGKWNSIRKNSFAIGAAYSIYYEELSKLIYVADDSNKQVFVVRRDDFSIVKTMGGFQSNYGMMVDKRSGLMYISSTVGHSVIVYQ